MTKIPDYKYENTWNGKIITIATTVFSYNSDL